KLEDHASIFKLAPPPLPKIWIDAAAQAKADQLVSVGSPILALGPAANWAPKSWDIGNFIEVAHRLLDDKGLMPHARLMIVAAPHERAQVQPLLDAFPPEQIIDLIGNDLLTVAACLSKAHLFIGNDSGLMHMSSAMAAPTLGLFGPSNDRIYGPHGPRALAVRTPESRKELFAMQPYPGANTPLLMGSLTIEAVMAGVEKLLSQHKPTD
ncbi:MAG: glycosyltransferase family 9 protein, partial [Alphaproteobacteria bacterium]|nr:glycosyltransferase family 9 protein [Alphaproteobacteria bacterium]